MVTMVLEISTTRDIARQILRHRSFSFQEFSQRYASVIDLGFTTGEARLQDSKNRQNSLECTDEELKLRWHRLQTLAIEGATQAYEFALSAGIAKEVARKVMPEGLTNSKMYMSGTIRSWIHYCELRCAEGTQLEHREIAIMCRDILLKQIPSLTTILE